MSKTTLDGVYASDPDLAEGVASAGPAPAQDPPPAGGWPKWLRARTGPGPVSDYREHPANFDRSDGLAQAIRGLTGLVGDLDLAVVDIALGAWRWIAGRRRPV